MRSALADAEIREAPDIESEIPLDPPEGGKKVVHGPEQKSKGERRFFTRFFWGMSGNGRGLTPENEIVYRLSIIRGRL